MTPLQERIDTLREYSRISEAGQIARRAFANNSFDGVLTMIGVVMGSFVVGVDDAKVVLVTGLSTALAIGEDVLAISSFSKYFNMTGWRLGWLVAPRSLIPTLEKLAQVSGYPYQELKVTAARPQKKRRRFQPKRAAPPRPKRIF